jgi:type II restriction/modification system DNA methylase subunit YeeA
METAKLKRFAQFARRTLRDQVTAKLKLVLAEGSAARRESAAAVQALEEQISLHSQDQIIERVSYTWFNRFCALRFMDVNRYNSVGVLSPERGQFQPEILAEAKMGHIDSEMVPERTRQQVAALLDGKSPSREPQSEAYRLLVVAVCNFWNVAMPFLFTRIADYTELLMPDDLLSGISVVTLTREAMTPDVCQDVEVIGWLYQFYISERKDQVFEGLKKGKKITPENIPAATQLFTPHWIVRYLVENSLGRLWMLNRPQSKLVEKMDYYIKPEQPETEFPRIGSPEEIRICDPACGSGHMLVYAFDLLYSIYEEEGYPSTDIPEKILRHNLFGIEIDERAGELAAFALTMIARSRNSRFLRKPVQPNICVLANVQFKDDELKHYMNFVGRDVFTSKFKTTLRQFEEADNFGSLIRPDVAAIDEMLRVLGKTTPIGDLFLVETHRQVVRLLNQAEYLLPKYHVVLANPPYMGTNGMNSRMAVWVREKYPNSKSDLFAMFIERNLELALSSGFIAMITMQGFMFLSSFEKLRVRLLNEHVIISMAHLGTRAFDSIGGEVVSTTAFVLQNTTQPRYRGRYLRLVDKSSETQKANALIDAIEHPDLGWNYRKAATDFKKIPGWPLAYWVSDAFLNLFEQGARIASFVNSRDGLNTGNNEQFIKFWWEVAIDNIAQYCKSDTEFWDTNRKWAPLVKGGPYRKWYGNVTNVITYDRGSYRVLGASGNKLPSREFYFRDNLNWTRISSPAGSFRYCPPGCVFESASLCAYSDTESDLLFALAAANSAITPPQLMLINPTVNLLSGYFNKLTLPKVTPEEVNEIADLAKTCIDIAKNDWDQDERSTDFRSIDILKYRRLTVARGYAALRAAFSESVNRLRSIEARLNDIFINLAGVQHELSAKPDESGITLIGNPHYRYTGNRSENELEALLLADTIKEFVSYAVGCMFGRYALDVPGLILANQGDGIQQYLQRIRSPAFTPDEDNVIPILGADWFPDDISVRFKSFLRVTFGNEHFNENLDFIEQSIGKDIGAYFVRDFYGDHVKRYKKRPIYWLFSSPKGSFNALIYMHRYRPDTVSVVLNDYLREFRNKLTSSLDKEKRKEASADTSKAEKTRALKEIESLKRTIDELSTWEREVLYPLATQQIEIDLDDGVKVNYAKFGAALKKIPGLDLSEE